jgi:hypothetical protein
LLIKHDWLMQVIDSLQGALLRVQSTEIYEAIQQQTLRLNQAKAALPSPYIVTSLSDDAVTEIPTVTILPRAAPVAPEPLATPTRGQESTIGNILPDLATLGTTPIRASEGFSTPKKRYPVTPFRSLMMQ